MTHHSWWIAFGQEVAADDLVSVLARDLASRGLEGRLPGVTITGLRESSGDAYTGVAMDVEVERPQELAYSIKAVEPIAVLFPFDGGQPSVLALRDDFPDTFHQNWSPPDAPCALCIDDRPWAEARLTATAGDIARRVQLWLSRAARGELHDAAQPPDPLFFDSQLTLVLPAAAVFKACGPVELTGFVREDNETLVVTRDAQLVGSPPTFTLFVFRAIPRQMGRLRHAPRTLRALAEELEACGIDLYKELKCRLRSWAGLGAAQIRRLSTRLAIVIVFPVVAGEQESVNDVRAFMLVDTAGDLGVGLGTLHRNDSRVGDGRAYVPAIRECGISSYDVPVHPANVHLSLDRAIAAAVAGRTTVDTRPAVLVGSGSLGSQLSLNLAREGLLSWTVVDDDYLLPHNFTRHALFPQDIGAPKANALAQRLGELLDEPVDAIQCDVLRPDDDTKERLATAFVSASVIVDASASVAVSRHLSDIEGSEARRMSAFFNPAGTAVVLLAEDACRSITLRDLEAQYYGVVSSDVRLASHLDTIGLGVRYSGSCRSLTNRIPASNAALLAGLAARGVARVLSTDEATIAIWVLDAEGEVGLIRRRGATVSRTRLGDWTISYDAGLVGYLVKLRDERLPRETGGVLFGVTDMSRKSIYIASALPEPDDSCGSETGFERGIVNLQQEVGRVVTSTMHQLRYVGEWHSHPDHASPLPSSTDMGQLACLGRELEAENLPGLMAIVSQGGSFTVGIHAIGSIHQDNDRGDAPR